MDVGRRWRRRRRGIRRHRVPDVPRHRGQVEVRRTLVHRAALRHHTRAGPHRRVTRAGQVDRCHPGDAQPGELAGRRHGAAVERRAHVAVAAIGTFTEGARHPVVDRGLLDDALVLGQSALGGVPEHARVHEGQPRGQLRCQHQPSSAVRGACGDQRAFEVLAFEQHRCGRVDDVEQRHHDLLTRVPRLGGHHQARPGEDELVAALRHGQRGHHIGRSHIDDAHPVLAGDEQVRAVGLDDVALVDAHLLGVGLRIRRHRGRRRGSHAAGAVARRSRGLSGSRHVATGVRVVAVAEPPFGHSLERVLAKVAEQLRAVGEEAHTRRPEATEPRSVVRHRRYLLVGRRGRRGRCRVGVVGDAAGQTGQGHSEYEHSSSTSHGCVTTRHCPRFPGGSERLLGSRRTAAAHQR